MSYGIGCVDVPLPRVLWTGQVQLERNITMAMQKDRAMGVLGQLLIRGFPHVRLLSLTLPPSSTPSHHLLSSILSQLTCSSLGQPCHLVK